MNTNNYAESTEKLIKLLGPRSNCKKDIGLLGMQLILRALKNNPGLINEFENQIEFYYSHLNQSNINNNLLS